MRKMTKNSNFYPDCKINEEIKSGLWKELYMNVIDIEKILDNIADRFDLTKYVSELLEFRYVSHTQGYWK